MEAITPLLQLADGIVITMMEDHDNTRGCDTCNFGSSYVQNFTIKTTAGTLRMEIDNMYEYGVSHQFLFEMLLPRVEEFKTMTIKQFFDWFRNEIRAGIDSAKIELDPTDVTFEVTH